MIRPARGGGNSEKDGGRLFVRRTGPSRGPSRPVGAVKLLEKQPAGQKRMKTIGRVEIPQKALMTVLAPEE